MTEPEMPGPGAGFRVLRLAALLAVASMGTLVVALIYLYLTESPTVAMMLAAGSVTFVLLEIVRRLSKMERRAVAGAGLGLIVALCVAPAASAFFPGGITAATSGLTVVGACPIPIFDITISAGGTLWFRNKTHQVTLEEAQAAAAGAEILIVGTGWTGAVSVDDRVKQLPGLQVEIHRTEQAIELYNRLRREGRRVALLLHSTC